LKETALFDDADLRPSSDHLTLNPNSYV